MNGKHMDEISLVATPGLRDGRGACLSKCTVFFLRTRFENIFGSIPWSQWKTGLPLREDVAYWQGRWKLPHVCVFFQRLGVGVVRTELDSSGIIKHGSHEC
jgi:hypothetical protein